MPKLLLCIVRESAFYTIIMKKLLSEEIPREGESVDCWGNLGKYSDLEYLGEPEDGGHCFYDNETETEYHSEIDGITHWRYSDD